MTRGLRTLHRVGWLLLAAALAVGLGLALTSRPQPVHDPAAEPLPAQAVDVAPGGTR